jgi:hypothetical protein
MDYTHKKKTCFKNSGYCFVDDRIKFINFYMKTGSILVCDLLLCVMILDLCKVNQIQDVIYIVAAVL